MTPSLNKCPRCGTLRPNGEVAHTCVVRNPADTGTSREGDPYAEIAALKNDLAEIAAIIESVDMRAAATDGPVTPTLQEMTQEEISRIYAIANSARRRGK